MRSAEQTSIPLSIFDVSVLNQFVRFFVVVLLRFCINSVFMHSVKEASEMANATLEVLVVGTVSVE